MTQTGYHPEMGEKRPEGTQIDARMGHYGRHWYLRTPLVLKGRGITHLETYTAEMLTPAAQDKVGWHSYKVTIAAFERLSQQYRVAFEMLL